MPDTTYAQMKHMGDTAIIECIHNRDLYHVQQDMTYFFLLTPEAHRNLGVDVDAGEIAIYNPDVKVTLPNGDKAPTVWVALREEFDIITDRELLNV